LTTFAAGHLSFSKNAASQAIRWTTG